MLEQMEFIEITKKLLSYLSGIETEDINLMEVYNDWLLSYLSGIETHFRRLLLLPPGSFYRTYQELKLNVLERFQNMLLAFIVPIRN